MSQHRPSEKQFKDRGSHQVQVARRSTTPAKQPATGTAPSVDPKDITYTSGKFGREQGPPLPPPRPPQRVLDSPPAAPEVAGPPMAPPLPPARPAELGPVAETAPVEQPWGGRIPSGWGAEVGDAQKIGAQLDAAGVDTTKLTVDDWTQIDQLGPERWMSDRIGRGQLPNPPQLSPEVRASAQAARGGMQPVDIPQPVAVDPDRMQRGEPMPPQPRQPWGGVFGRGWGR